MKAEVPGVLAALLAMALFAMLVWDAFCSRRATGERDRGCEPQEPGDGVPLPPL